MDALETAYSNAFRRGDSLVFGRISIMACGMAAVKGRPERARARLRMERAGGKRRMERASGNRERKPRIRLFHSPLPLASSTRLFHSPLPFAASDRCFQFALSTRRPRSLTA